MLNQIKKTIIIIKTKEDYFQQKVNSILHLSGECERDYGISTCNIFSGWTFPISSFAQRKKEFFIVYKIVTAVLS